MKRLSTDAEYLNSGKIVLDADGIPVDLGYRGTGSPEGKVAAPVGSIYTDTAATNGAIRWIKSSGTGNTGWRVQCGETGTRDVSNLITNASGTLTIFRTGNVVFMDAMSVTPTDDLSSGGTFINSLPSGFRPTMRRNFSLPSNPSGGTMRSAFQLPAGSVGVWVPSIKDHYHLHLSWYTSDTWPTTLPGTPA